MDELTTEVAMQIFCDSIKENEQSLLLSNKGLTNPQVKARIENIAKNAWLMAEVFYASVPAVEGEEEGFDGDEEDLQ